MDHELGHYLQTVSMYLAALQKIESLAEAAPMYQAFGMVLVFTVAFLAARLLLSRPKVKGWGDFSVDGFSDPGYNCKDWFHTNRSVCIKTLDGRREGMLIC